MIKIKMLVSRPLLGGAVNCYLKGMTYTLATPAEMTMARAFVRDRHAELIEDATEPPAKPSPKVKGQG